MDEKERRAIEHFNRGEYMEGHELFEAIWVESSGERKKYLQGIIQIGAAIIKIKLQPNLSASERLLHKGIGRLREIDRKLCPIDIDRLVREAEILLKQLDGLGAGELEAFPESALPLLHYRLQGDCFGGQHVPQ